MVGPGFGGGVARTGEFWLVVLVSFLHREQGLSLGRTRVMGYYTRISAGQRAQTANCKPFCNYVLSEQLGI